MNDDLDKLYYEWGQATGDLQWGVQRAFHSVFEGVQNDGTTLVYGSDYLSGFPCLVNTVGTMLTTGGGHGVPSQNFGRVVSLFDQINRILATMGVNTEPGHVSPLAADIFLTHFAPLKEVPIAPENITPYYPPVDEITDHELEQGLKEMFLTPAPVEREDVPVEISTDYYNVGD